MFAFDQNQLHKCTSYLICYFLILKLNFILKLNAESIFHESMKETIELLLSNTCMEIASLKSDTFFVLWKKNLTIHTFVHAVEAVPTTFAVVKRLPTRYVACCTVRDVFKYCARAQTKADIFLVKKDKKVFKGHVISMHIRYLLHHIGLF